MYPSWRYHISGESRIIHSAAEEQEGWESTVAAFGIETAPGATPDPAIAARRAELAEKPVTKKKGK